MAIAISVLVSVYAGPMTTDFAEILREYREAAGLSQNGLARAAGVDPTNLNRLERGRQLPRGATVLKLIQGFGWPVTDPRAGRLLRAARVDVDELGEIEGTAHPELRRAVAEVRSSLLSALEQLNHLEERLDALDVPVEGEHTRRPGAE